MPDHVPGSVQIRKMRSLYLPFLRAILAEMAHTRFIQLAYLLKAMRLRNMATDELVIVVRAPSGARSRSLNALTDARRFFEISLYLRANCSARSSRKF